MHPAPHPRARAQPPHSSHPSHTSPPFHLTLSPRSLNTLLSGLTCPGLKGRGWRARTRIPPITSPSAGAYSPGSSSRPHLPPGVDDRRALGPRARAPDEEERHASTVLPP
eukprot:3055428-Rhodomonas_salina.3